MQQQDAAQFTTIAFGDIPLKVKAHALHDKISIAESWDWPEQKRVGNTPVLQYTGQNSGTLTLPCAVFPKDSEDEEALGILPKLKAAAQKGEPRHLTMQAKGGEGRKLGSYVLKSIGEEQSHIRADGSPAQITFSLSFVRYD